MTSPPLPTVRTLQRVPRRVRFSRVVVVALTLVVGAGSGYAAGLRGAPSASAEPTPAIRAEVHFSPHGGCTEAVVGLIDEAKRTVRVQAYGFTSQPIVAALEAAKVRGVDVEVVLDRSDEDKPEAGELAAAGVPVFIDRAHPIAHNKVTIVDGIAVETGSFNYTKQAEKNAENCPIIRDAAFARAYAEQWAAHRAHAERFR